MPLSKQRYVIVIDDEEVVQDAFAKAFEGQDEFVLDQARTVREALEKLDVVQYHFIFLDMKIGHSWAGMQILRQINRLEIRERGRGHSLVEARITLMSGSVSFDECMAEANELEALTFMKKPILFDAAYVRRILNRLGVPLLPPATPLTGPPGFGTLPA